MTYETTTFEREVLYRKVWAEPGQGHHDFGASRCRVCIPEDGLAFFGGSDAPRPRIGERVDDPQHSSCMEPAALLVT